MNIFSTKHFLTYKLFSTHGKGHGIHSPFIYSLIREVFLLKHSHSIFSAIETRRKELKKIKATIEVKDLGAGSKKQLSAKRVVAQIAHTSLTHPKYCRLLYGIAKHYKLNKIMELGTSLGISAGYLAKAATHVTTIEACHNIAAIAKETFTQIEATNITLINKPFDDALDDELIKKQQFDLIFFDGNHTKEATLKYFNTCLQLKHSGSVFIFDDIYWSEDMFEAWTAIKADKNVSLSIDIYKFGLVFFNEGVVKQDFKIRF